MKIAICFSGKIDELDKSFSYWKNIIENYNMEVFGSFWETDIETKELFQKFNPKKVEFEDFNCFQATIDIFNQEMKVPLYPNINHGLSIDDGNYIMKNNILSMWYKIWRANMLSKINKYDIVIRSRIDVYFDKLNIIKNNYLNIPWGWRFNDKWKGSGGPIDMFAFGNSEIMDYYSSCFLYLSRYLKENQYFFPAENILKAHIIQRKFDICLFPSKLFLSRDNSCFNQAYGIDNDEIFSSIIKNTELDLNYTFYKSIL